MTDQEFREQYQPLHVPAHFDADAPLTEQTLYALAQVGQGTADDVLMKLKELRGGESDKQVIAEVHQLLTGWYQKGLVAGSEREGSLHYGLQKVTEANDGKVDPELLAPGLD